MPRLSRRITKSVVDGLTARPGELQSFFWDPELQGFGVKVTSSGMKSYVVKRRNHRMVIDRASVISVEEARQRAVEFLADVGRGANPIAVRRREAEQARVQERQELSVRGVWEEYRAAKRQLRARTIGEYDYALRTYCADWFDRPLSALTKSFIAEEHTRIRELVARGARSRLVTGNSTANGVMRIVRALWNFAAEQELVSGLGRNPVGTLSANKAWYPEVVRNDYIPLVDLPVFFRAIGEYRSPQLEDDRSMGDLVLLMLFTGLRLNEARSLRWAHVDSRRGLIRLAADETKAKRPLDLPLSEYVGALLAARPRDSEWVFQGARHHVVDPRPALRHAARALAVHHGSADVRAYYVSPHALRRTFVTVAESCDLSAYTVKALVNHSFGSDVTAGYIGRDYSRLRDGAQRVADRLLQLAARVPRGPGQPASRVPIWVA